MVICEGLETVENGKKDYTESYYDDLTAMSTETIKT